MSAILALVDPHATEDEREQVVARWLAAAPSGGPVRQIRSHGAVTLGVARAAWECEAALDGPAEILAAHGWLVVTDGQCYSASQDGRSLPAARVVEQLVAGGPSALTELEADLAVLALRVGDGALVLHRDAAARRDLVFARAGHRLICATDCETLLAAGVSADPDAEQLVLVASFIDPRDDRTVYAAIRRVPPGRVLVTRGTPGSLPEERAAWRPPTFRSGPSPLAPIERDAALREALTGAMRARMRQDGNAVLMSGGYDSTAIFAAGRATGAQDDVLRAVSVAHARGSAADEADYVDAVAARWQARVTWAPLPGDVARWFAERLTGAIAEAEPCTQPFGFAMAALAKATREDGAVVAFDGGLGDVLFRSGPARLAGDLVARGRALAGWRLLRRGGWSRRAIIAEVLPLFGPGPTWLASRLIGQRLQHPDDVQLAPWVRASALARRALERARSTLPRRDPGETRSQHAQRLAITTPTFARGAVGTQRIFRALGVHCRSPFWSAEVQRVAADAPPEDRWEAGEGKIGLRRAMAPWLPSVVLAPRPRRTGAPDDLMAAALRDAMPPPGEVPYSEWWDETEMSRWMGALAAGRLAPAALLPVLQTRWVDGWLRRQRR